MTDHFVPVERFVLRDILDNDLLLRSKRAIEMARTVTRDPSGAYASMASTLRKHSVPLPEELEALRLAAGKAGRLEDAEVLLAEKARIPSGVPNTAMAHAAVLLELKREADAGRIFAELSKRHPGEVRFWVQAVTGLWRGGSHGEAERVLQAGEAACPGSQALANLRKEIGAANGTGAPER
jgi:hypothetical protein